MFKRKLNASMQTRLLRKLFLLLLLVTACLALIVLTSCQSLIKYTPAKVETKEIVKDFLPDMPVYPGFPNVTWSFIDGRYTLSEQDVDKILNWGENEIPKYLYEMEQYERKLQVIMDSL